MILRWCNLRKTNVKQKFQHLMRCKKKTRLKPRAVKAGCHCFEKDSFRIVNTHPNFLIIWYASTSYHIHILIRFISPGETKHRYTKVYIGTPSRNLERLFSVWFAKLLSCSIVLLTLYNFLITCYLIAIEGYSAWLCDIQNRVDSL